MPDPTVTISIPARNAASTLPLAIASIRAQTYRDWELIIIDDGSTDGTTTIASEAERQDDRIRAVSDGRHLGVTARLNQVIDLARGEHFARMDADDLAYPTRLQRQLDFLATRPRVDLVGSSMLVFGREGVPIGKRTCPATHEEICARPGAGFPLFHPTWLGRTSWFRRYAYDHRAVRCEDQDLLFRAHAESTFANIPEILLGYREANLLLRPILRGRKNYTRRVAGALWGSGEPLRAALTVAEQGAKGLVDSVAIGLGLDRVLLRHRARSVSGEEREAWIAIWEDSVTVAERALSLPQQLDRVR